MRALIEFLDSRLGLGEFIRKTATEKRPPKTTGWLHTLGYATLSVFVLQAITGVALAFFYVPSAEHAYDSIRILQREVAGGALLRALHHFGASAMVVLAFVHAVRVFFTGAYKRPREFTWLTGLGMFGVLAGLAFTGYLLPWDQKAYYATKVGVNIAAETPMVGEYLKYFLYGGSDIGPQTLNRFFAMHVLVLPPALVLLLVLHLQQIQRHGVAPLGAAVDDPGVPGRPYHPYHTIKEAIVALAAIAIVFVLAMRLGAPLEAEADPADLAYEPRPDWYFFAPFQLLKLFPGDLKILGTFGLPALLGGVLVLLPFIDRNPGRALRRRPVAVVLGTGFVLSVLVLTTLGAMDKPKHYRTPPHPLRASTEVRMGYDLTRREGCLSCHTMTASKLLVYGREHADGAPDLMDVEYDPQDLAAFLLDPGSDVMPGFPHLSEAERIAIGRYLASLRQR